MTKLILASASPRRRQLLTQVGLDFVVDPSTHEKEIDNNIPFGELACQLAEHKVLEVAKNHTEGIILGADTIVAVDDKILGKPRSKSDAVQMLKSLSGRWHSVYTGLFVLDVASGKKQKEYDESRVKFKEISAKEIENYVKTGEPMDKAGAYGIQGKGALLVEKIEGCYYNIVGLPLFKLSKLLSEFGIELL
jgi:septum formation protein